MIIAIGFKVNNERAVQFRKWANQIYYIWIKNIIIYVFDLKGEL